MPSGIGYFCGTFDPIHVAHLEAARFVRNEFKLEMVSFLPAGIPPNKVNQNITSSNHRLEMIRLAIDNEIGLSIETLEVDKPSLSFMIETVSELKEIKKNKTIYLIMGSDNLSSFHTWKNFQNIFEFVEIIVVSRSNQKALEFPELKRYLHQIHFSAAPYIELSSTWVREKIKAGHVDDSLIPQAVLNYIRKHKLYT